MKNFLVTSFFLVAIAVMQSAHGESLLDRVLEEHSPLSTNSLDALKHQVTYSPPSVEVLPTISGRGETGDVRGCSRISGLLGITSGSDTDTGFSPRIEADYGFLDWPVFISLRGDASVVSVGGSSDYSKDVYGRHGYSYREYFYDYGDRKDIKVGGTAALLWDPFFRKSFRLFGGVGCVFRQTKWDADVTETIVDHHSYGRNLRSGGYTHRYYRTKRLTNHYSDNGSESQSSILLRGGASWTLNSDFLVSAEFSHMPDHYEDSSESELRFSGSVSLTARTSLEVSLEYLLEAETYFGGIGYSVWFR